DLRGLRRRISRRAVVAGKQSENDPARGREDHRDDDGDDGAAQSEVDAADAESATAAAARLFNVVAGTPLLPKHDDSPSPGPRPRIGHFAASTGGSQVRAIARAILNGCPRTRPAVQGTIARL